MAQIRPFQCIRPKEELASHIAALPYDVYNRKEAKKEIEKEPLSFLKIDRAETQLPDDIDTYDHRVYEKAHDTLWDMIRKGDFEQETKPCYYIYRLTMNGRSQSGIVACASIDDYEDHIIKKHENTREDKELDRISHVDICNAQTGPIFLAYRSNDMINQVTGRYQTEKALYDFTSEDGISHTVWRISDQNDIRTIQDAFHKMNQIYIADGHHRCASAVKVGLKRRREAGHYSGQEDFNYFLSVLFPDDQLMIMDYNRVVKDLNGYTPDEFLEKLKDVFSIQLEEGQYRPEKKGEFGMFLSDRWYRLELKDKYKSTHPVAGLDVSILQEQVLAPVLNIFDPKTDHRIDFVGGIRGLEELERRVRSDCEAAFAMYPTSIEELFNVADAGLLMPPKSTWFEPKLRSGLFIHALDGDMEVL